MATLGPARAAAEPAYLLSMTTEAEALARLLAYYEDRTTLLAGRIAALEALQVVTEDGRARTVENNLKRARTEIADLQEKGRRLREAITSG